MNYTELRAACNDWLARSDFTTANTDLFIDLAEARIARSLRVRAMESVYNELLDAAGTTPYAPATLELKHLFLVDVNDDGFLQLSDDFTIDASTLLVQAFSATNRVIRLEWKSIDAMAEEYDHTRQGVPKYVTRYGDRLYFWPLNTSFQYTAVGIQYGAITPLSDAAPSNYFSETTPDLLLAATLFEAATYVKSPQQAGIWSARYDRALNELQSADDRQEYSATPLTQRPRRTGP